MSDDKEFLLEDDRTKKFAVSTTEAMAEEFKKLAETLGMSQKDLFAAMIGTYKASNAVSGVNKTKEIQDLDRHLRRVQEIYVAMVNELSDCREEAQRTVQALTQENAEKLRAKNEEIDGLKLELQTFQTMYQEQKEKADQLEQTVGETRRTIELIEKANSRLEEENNVLRSQIQNFEHLAVENEELKNQVVNLKKEVDTLTAQVATLEKNAEQKAAEYEERIEKLKAEHKAEIEKIQLAHEKEKFQLEKSMAVATDAIKNKKDAEIDELKNRIYELETEKNKLVEELLKLRAETEKTKTGKNK